MAASLSLHPTIHQCAYGIYVMVREGNSGTDSVNFRQFRSTQQDDISQLVMKLAFYGYGMYGQVSWRRNARLAVVWTA